MTIRDGRIVPANFDGYRCSPCVMRPTWRPFAGSRRRQACGVGEPPIDPVYAAVGNRSSPSPARLRRSLHAGAHRRAMG
ncbi:MAG: hypothetical protein H6644_20655 [Caldilineaceae bacterium]|nr:hypothetical protein [Caldilineaceae bacterium]